MGDKKCRKIDISYFEFLFKLDFKLIFLTVEYSIVSLATIITFRLRVVNVKFHHAHICSDIRSHYVVIYVDILFCTKYLKYEN